MAEHQDRGFFYQGGEPKKSPLIGVPQKPTWEKTAQEVEEERRARLEAESLSFQERKNKLLAKYQAFLDDKTNLNLVNKNPPKWMGPGFIIELFVADFSEDSKLLGMDDIYQKFTPFAKVLSSSPHTEGPKVDIEEGDIVFLGDAIAGVRPNQKWIDWVDGNKANAPMEGKAPIQYIRQVHSWISEGRLYFPDKAAYVLSFELTKIDENYLKTFKGPWIFRVDPMAIVWPISHNPFE